MAVQGTRSSPDCDPYALSVRVKKKQLTDRGREIHAMCLYLYYVKQDDVHVHVHVVNVFTSGGPLYGKYSYFTLHVLYFPSLF